MSLLHGLHFTHRQTSSESNGELTRGTKRKASQSPLQTDEHNNSSAINAPDGDVARLVSRIMTELTTPILNDTIQECSLWNEAWKKNMASISQGAMNFAFSKLKTWAYRDVPECYSRLYEDAALYQAAKLLDDLSHHAILTADPAKHIIFDKSNQTADFENKIAEIVKILDAAIILAGAPARKPLIEDIFCKLGATHRVMVPQSPCKELATANRDTQGSNHANVLDRVPTFDKMTFEDFQQHLDQSGSPRIMTGIFNDWPAHNLWYDLSYLKSKTLGGHRIVPVEIGASYNEANWRQEMMTFNNFAERFLVPEVPDEMGYLAQHDLFAQIPALRDDITIPEICYTSPPAPRGVAASTVGLSDTPQLTEPIVNAWLGPKGTKSPLHTDPYHNILCQVAGYKYVRLYPPAETDKLYTGGVDEAGISMANTSQVDVWPFVENLGRHMFNRQALEEIDQNFPKFKNAKYKQAILGPGDALYIPLGWWHYVESLSVSFSVSMWFN